MSEIGISYNAWTEPSSVSARFDIGLSDTTVRATVRQVAPFIVVLEPSGNVSEQIASSIAWPLAQSLGVTLVPLATQLIDGRSFDVITIEPPTERVAGYVVTTSLDNLSVDNYNGMLMVKGSLVTSIKAGG